MTMLHTVRDDTDFFSRLLDIPEASRVLDAFDRMVDKPMAMSAPIFHSRLYHTLVDYLLYWLDLPRSVGAPEWEWRALYQFGLETNPFYYSEAAIHELLGQWTWMEADKKHVLATVLHGYFQLRRQGFPTSYPSPLVSNTEIAQWMSLFPPEYAWKCQDVLRKLGMATMSGPLGYRSYVRYVAGHFQPTLTPATVRQWQSTLWQHAGLFSRSSASEDAAPFRAAFLIAAFAGRFVAVGFEGFCGDVPACDRCPLRESCAWYSNPAADAPGPDEILTLSRLGRIEFLSDDQLFQGLFDLPEEKRDILQRKLAPVGLRQLSRMSRGELAEWLGQGLLSAEKLSLLFELCKRFNEERMVVGVTFRTPWDVFKHFRMRMRDMRQEQFIAVLLDNRRRYLSDHVITQGTLDTSPVHPREVFNAAVRESAAAVVIVHNHPSGDPTPSADDMEVTRRLQEAGSLMGIPVLDHIIIADDQYTSLMDRGLFDQPRG